MRLVSGCLLCFAHAVPAACCACFTNFSIMCSTACPSLVHFGHDHPLQGVVCCQRRAAGRAAPRFPLLSFSHHNR